METITLGEACKEMETLPGRMGRGEPLAVTKRGKPVLAVLSWERYQSMVETMEVLADKELCAAIRRGIDDAREGRVLSSEEVPIVIAYQAWVYKTFSHTITLKDVEHDEAY